jgi:hypothetical protein
MTKTTIVSTEEVNKIVEGLQEVKRSMTALKKQEEALKQKLYNYMGEHDVMVNCETGEEFVHWTYSEGYMKFDQKKFEEDKPKIYKQYLFKTEPVRTLRISK